MNRHFAHPMSRIASVAFLIATCLPASGLDQKDISFSGLGWVQYGSVVHSTDTANFNFNGNSTQASGSQISLLAKVSEKFEGAAGLGVLENHFLAGNTGLASRVPMTMSPYIAEARFTYTFLDGEKSKLKLTGGLFPYNYNSDVKNLGLYLLRGPVYPGILISGFETKHVLPIANMSGFRLQHQNGIFEENLILNSETEFFPLFDLSLAYIANIRWGQSFEIGGGVNFHRLVPIESKLTSPNRMSPDGKDIEPGDEAHPNRRVWTHVDTTGMGAGGPGDTTYLSFKGTKVMAKAAMDPKVWVGGIEVLGKEDLKVYAEVAIIGLNNSKAYREIYGEYKNRMPVLVGMNLPVFKLLDHLSLEVEYYGAKFRDDLMRYQQSLAYYESPLPVSNSDLGRSKVRIGNPNVPGDSLDVMVGTTIPFDDVNVEKPLRKDDFKWSLHGSKVIQGHFNVSFQIANDHFRPGGVTERERFVAILSTPKDWYWMTKVAYFF